MRRNSEQSRSSSNVKSSRPRGALTAASALCAFTLILSGAPLAAHAEGANGSEVSSGSPADTGSPLADKLVEASEAGLTEPHEIAEELSLPASGGGSLTFDSSGRVAVTVMFSQMPNDATLNEITALAHLDGVSATFPAASVSVSPHDISRLTEIPTVVSAAPAIRGFTAAELNADPTITPDSVSESTLPETPLSSPANAPDSDVPEGQDDVTSDKAKPPTSPSLEPENSDVSTNGQTPDTQTEPAEQPGIADTPSETPENTEFTQLPFASVAPDHALLASQGSNATVAVPSASGSSCRAVPSEADSPTRAAIARQKFGLSGAGVKIGIVSDSFNTTSAATNWAKDIRLGVLPGTGNPCGNTTPVRVLDDSAGGGDEGRAMAQLIHGIAPKAELLFATAGYSEVNMADNVVALAQAGARIIVDDMLFLDEPFYQKGIISAAIEYVKVKYNVSYFSAVGNSNSFATTGNYIGRPMGSWQTTAYRPMTCPSWVRVSAGQDCLDFNPSPTAAQAYDVLNVGYDTSVITMGSIAEPLYGISTEYEVRYYQATGGTPRLLDSMSSLGGSSPALLGQTAMNGGTKVYMVMVRTAHNPKIPPPAVYLGFIRGGQGITSRQFMGNGKPGSSASDWVGVGAIGHSGDGTSLGVASAAWDAPAQIRGYSSLGPVRMMYPSVGYPAYSIAPKAKLARTQLVSSPHITGVDGMATSFFASLQGSTYRFYGTSAAAPVVAAVAALGLQYAPGTSATQLNTALMKSARGLAKGGPENPYTDAGFSYANTLGSGLVDADAFITSLPYRATPNKMKISNKTAKSAKLSWSMSGVAKTQTITLRDGYSPSGKIVKQKTLNGTSRSLSFTGLKANHKYTAQIYAQNSVRGGKSSYITFLTKPATPVVKCTTAANTLTISWAENNEATSYALSIVSAEDPNTELTELAPPPSQSSDPAPRKTDATQPSEAIAEENSLPSATELPGDAQAPLASAVIAAELATVLPPGTHTYTLPNVSSVDRYTVKLVALNELGESATTTTTATVSEVTAADHQSGLAKTGGAPMNTTTLFGIGAVLLGAFSVLLHMRTSRKKQA